MSDFGKQSSVKDSIKYGIFFAAGISATLIIVGVSCELSRYIRNKINSKREKDDNEQNNIKLKQYR